MSTPRVAVVTLGCARNEVDSEELAGRLASAGFSLVDEPEASDVVVVNTCGFIASAKEESIDAILDMARYKQIGKCRALVVTGCLAQRYEKDLMQEIPEIDLLMGVNQYQQLPDALEKALGGVRNEEEAAASLGVNPDHYKVFAFGIGTFIAGMTGSVYAHFMGFISSTDFSFPVSVGVLSMAVLGGLGTVSGPLLGAIILTLSPEVFRFVSDYRMLVYGGLLVLMMRFQPQGLVGDDSVLRRKWAGLCKRGKGGERHG